MAHQRKSIIQAIFLHSKQQKPYQGTLRTQKPLKLMVPDTIIFKPISGCVYHFYIAPYLAPPIILEHFFGHCGTLSGLNGPSWTFMVQTDQFFYIGLQITNKLKTSRLIRFNMCSVIQRQFICIDMSFRMIVLLFRVSRDNHGNLVNLVNNG